MRLSERLITGVLSTCLMLAGGGRALAADAAKAPRADKHSSAKSRAKKKPFKATTPAKANGVSGSSDAAAGGPQKPDTIREYRNSLGETVFDVSASQFDISAPLSDLAANATLSPVGEEDEEPTNPTLPPWRIPHSSLPDPVVQPIVTPGESLSSGGFTPAAPTTGFNFLGIGISGGSPSDSNGSVGNSQYVETVNTRYQVWSLNYGTKVATSVLGPSSINTLWAGFGGPCQTQNSGDPIVLYDKVANRWLISQFTTTLSSGAYYQCVAVSTTASATGTYARWAFAVPSGRFGDYPHFGVWTDAYYMMAHAFTSTSGSYVAGIFAAMDRTKMLAGDPTATWQVILDANEGGHMPADLDGFTPPPTGAPGIFLSLRASSMYVYRMKVDFVTPANTVRTLQASVPIAASTAACGGGTCIPQPGTTALLDSLADRLMFRVAYRNFVDHESLVVSHSVDPSVAGLVSGVRWYDFRLSGAPDAICPTYPCTYQQGTVADVANGRSRWMPSIAMDGAENILVGYSTTGKTNLSENHSLRYTGRAKSDPLGTMTAPETTIVTGIRNNTSNTRWGDYTSMSADPVDDCTFWYVSQYIPTTTSSWGTRVASASFPAGTGAGQCQATTCTSRPASAPTIGSAAVVGPNQISVSWTGIAPQPGAYAIERAVGACGSEGLYQPVTAVAGNLTSFVDTTVVGGLTYSYRVIAATDAAGKCQALVASGCASATATGTCSLKPGFTGAASGSSNNSATCGITVSWSAATASCPLTPNIRYNLFRGTTPDFVPSVANRIATCVPGPTSYVDTLNVSPGVTYYYVVRAEDDSTGNGGECGGGNEESNSIVVSGTAYGPGTQASPGTWADGGGDGTAFLQLNVAGAGDTSQQAWRFVSTASDAGANHTSGGAYAYRNTGPAAANNYDSSVCAEMQTPALTVGATTTNLEYWERHVLEYHWDGVAVEYQKNGGAWTDMPAPSNSTLAGCALTDTITGWENFSCTGSPAANACGYAATKSAYNGPVASGTACASWITSTTATAYAHRCHQITGLTAGDTVKFRWRFASDSSAVYGGFYLDDVAVTNVRLPNACTANPCAGQPDGTSCSDGNACTTGDTCQSGACTAGTATVCSASDQCHVAGICNPGTGVCSNPNASNGTTCTDGNACTQSDSCQAGLCTGANPVICAASDQCHVAGTCNPGSGFCSNPNANDGVACTDSNACTNGDSCQAGACAAGTPTVCTASDQCHVAGTCDTGTGACSNPSAADGIACTDNSACTNGDSCQAGTCTAGAPTVCSASDQCHVAGVCDTGTGVCSNPTAADGVACTDNNACTDGDSCQAGACSAGAPSVCTASDQCHVAGICDTGTGFCSNPAAADGVACTDNSACTNGDSCQAGTCTAGAPTVCTASDQCHVAGVCDTGTGVCSNPTAADGVACTDNNACTNGDSCQAGACSAGAPTVCTASDQCHVVGVCDTGTGVCSNPAAADGVLCTDNNACTTGDSCQSGACASGAPTVCSASDQCHVAGVCDTGTGFCSNPAATDGVSCTDNNSCTSGDSCQSGSCSAGTPTVCSASDQCHVAGICDTGTGFCSNPAAADGVACTDTNACTNGDSCQSGACAAGAPAVCTASDQCHVAGVCDTGTGFCSNPAAADGVACTDNNACTNGDSCQAGACAVGAPTVCTASDQCHVAGVCDTGTGFCTNPTAADGVACTDNNACTNGDSCQAGACESGSPTVCTASDQCHVAGVCDSGTGFCSNPYAADGTTCTDGNQCTDGDTCTAGVCGGTPVPPPAVIGDSVRVDKTPTSATIVWNDPPGLYNVYRGSMPADSLWSYNQTCAISGVGGSSASVTTDPAPDELFYYLVSRANACGESSLGTDSSGAPRPNGASCP